MPSLKEVWRLLTSTTELRPKPHQESVQNPNAEEQRAELEKQITQATSLEELEALLKTLGTGFVKPMSNFSEHQLKLSSEFTGEGQAKLLAKLRQEWLPVKTREVAKFFANMGKEKTLTYLASSYETTLWRGQIAMQYGITSSLQLREQVTKIVFEQFAQQVESSNQVDA